MRFGRVRTFNLKNKKWKYCDCLLMFRKSEWSCNFYSSGAVLLKVESLDQHQHHLGTEKHRLSTLISHLLNQQLWESDQLFREFWCTLKFENHCSRECVLRISVHRLKGDILVASEELSDSSCLVIVWQAWEFLINRKCLENCWRMQCLHMLDVALGTFYVLLDPYISRREVLSSIKIKRLKFRGMRCNLY